MIAKRNQDKKKQKGRPIVADARRLSKAVTVKFSKIDYEILRTRSRKTNRKLAEYIRESALKTGIICAILRGALSGYFLHIFCTLSSFT